MTFNVIKAKKRYEQKQAVREHMALWSAAGAALGLSSALGLLLTLAVAVLS